MTSPPKENLFPTLGEIAQKTEALRDVDDNDVRLNENAGPLIDQEEGEEREMQEIESLCMRCHEQVSLSIIIVELLLKADAMYRASLGCFSPVFHTLRRLSSPLSVATNVATGIPKFKALAKFSVRSDIFMTMCRSTDHVLAKG